MKTIQNLSTQALWSAAAIVALSIVMSSSAAALPAFDALVDTTSALPALDQSGQNAGQLVDRGTVHHDGAQPAQRPSHIMSPGMVLAASILLFLIAMLQAFFWTATRGTLRGIRSKPAPDKQQEVENLSNKASLALTAVGGFAAPLIAVAAGYHFFVDSLAIDLSDPTVTLTLVFVIPILMGGLIALIALTIPWPHQKTSPLFALALWGLPALPIGLLLFGLELPHHWDMPLTNSALIWADILWLGICGLGLIIFPRMSRRASVGLMFVLHHLILVPPAYVWAMQTDPMMLLITGTYGLFVYIFFWAFFMFQGANYRVTDRYRQKYSTHGPLTDGRGTGFSKHGGYAGHRNGTGNTGFSGGASSFVGGEASTNWAPKDSDESDEDKSDQ